MKKEEFDSKMTSMLDKLGNDTSSIILDDVANFLTDNENMNNELENKNKEIADLKKKNEMLQKVNGNLLMQVGVQDDNENKAPKFEDKGKPDFNMRSVFDKNGNFKQTL